MSKEDSALNKQVIATHSQHTEDLNVRPLLPILEDVLRLSWPPPDSVAIPPTPYPDTRITKHLRYPINKISCEITSKCASGGEPHKVTMDILKSLSKYSWDTKVAIAFAGFAANYGGFWLVEHHHNKNPIAKKIATLKNLPKKAMVESAELKMQFEAVVKFLTAAFEITCCLVQFNEFTPYINAESAEIKAVAVQIPTAVYWVMRGILVCASTLLSLVGGGREYVTSTWVSSEILNLASKLLEMLEAWKETMEICVDLVKRKKAEDAYNAMKKLLEVVHIDNMEVLRAFFLPGEDGRPLYNGTIKAYELLEELRLKYVLLLITDLDLPLEEAQILHLVHMDYSTSRRQYEIVWLPVVDQTALVTPSQMKTFLDLQNHMTWYSVKHLSVIGPVAIRYIREELGFTHLPMVVVLDPHGRLCNSDALPMMWVWGTRAFPFTSDWERKLWEESEWNIDLILDSICVQALEWIKENKVICLYGGDDIDWIRSFTRRARTAAKELSVPLEMLYVGRPNPNEKVRLCHEVISRENLSHIFATDYYDYIRYFWERLANMWNSKKQIGRKVEDDNIMKRILDLQTYDSSEQGWAIFSRGNYEITMGGGDKVVPVLEDYTIWKDGVDHPDMFVIILDTQLQSYHLGRHCHRLILPGKEGDTPERFVCSECGRTMSTFVMYQCCTTD